MLSGRDFRSGRAGGEAVEPEWKQILTGLAVDEAALLPGAAEAEGRLRLIRLAERLTPHVRHRTKYLDMPVTDHHAFVFSRNGRPSGERAHTLKEFVDVLSRTEPEGLQRHLEESHRLHRLPDINEAIIEAVQSRYEFTQEAYT